MTSKQLDKAFQKMLHSDIQGELYFSIEDYNPDSERGWIVFMDKDFEELYRCSPKMHQILEWYLSSPKKAYSKALNSATGYERALAVLDQQTGMRCIDDWNDDEDTLVQTFYELRKKYQSLPRTERDSVLRCVFS